MNIFLIWDIETCFEGKGGRIAWAQEFKTSLSSIMRPYLKKTKHNNNKNILQLEKLRQDSRFEAHLGNLVKPCLNKKSKGLEVQLSGRYPWVQSPETQKQNMIWGSLGLTLSVASAMLSFLKLTSVLVLAPDTWISLDCALHGLWCCSLPTFSNLWLSGYVWFWKWNPRLCIY